jgi:FixJ family two-component response regulator
MNLTRQHLNHQRPALLAPKARAQSHKPAAKRGDSPWVCLVEDDASVRTALRRLLISAGYHVEAFATALDCLDQSLFRDDWGCLVLDMSMPDMTGFELQQKLRECGCSPPLVFITGRDEAELRSQAIQAGAIGYLCKPFDGHDLMQAVDGAVRQNAARHR